MNYNLLEEKWIPVLGCDGKMRRVGIKEALTQVNRIRQIAASNPMDRVAILRFLLALLYWCKGNPPDNIKTTSTESFPTEWFSKLDENKECFNLLGDGKRFYQYCKSGSASDKKLSANYLIHEIPTGTNLRHFRHSTDKVDGLCLACCAMGLLRLPAFATQGGQGKSPGVNAKPPVYFIVAGSSLAVTLRLSWRQSMNLGAPAWEKPDLKLPKTGDVSLLTGLTWLPRRVWLDDPQDAQANCISCGRKERLILQCVFAGIGSTKTDEDSPGRVWRDPHVVYGERAKGGTKSLDADDALGTSDAAAAQWTNIIAGLLRDPKAFDNRNSISVVGFATVKNKYLEAKEYIISFPRTPIHSEATDKLEGWNRWYRWDHERQSGKKSSIVGNLRWPDEKESSRKHVEIPAIIATIRPHVEGRVFEKVNDLLTGDNAAWESAADEYRPMMKAIAKSLSPGFTTAVLERRKLIASIRPNMRPKPESAGEPHRKKGGKK